MKALVLPHVIVQNANAFPSPFSIGFPAVTAFMGAVHALERHLRREFDDVRFLSVGIISHKADLQVYKGPGDYVYSVVNTANPLDKKGERPSFIEEPRIHLDVSLVVEMEGIRKPKEKIFLEAVKRLMLSKMRLAAGDILHIGTPVIDRDLTHRNLMRHTGPGYALIEKRDVMQEAMEQGMDAIEALIDVLSIHHTCREDEGKVLWESKRKYEGWLVPAAIGFQGIGPLGKALNQRDPDTLHRFAESVVTLGEFKMPHRLGTIDEMMWEYRCLEAKNLYLCETKITPRSK